MSETREEIEQAVSEAVEATEEAHSSVLDQARDAAIEANEAASDAADAVLVAQIEADNVQRDLHVKHAETIAGYETRVTQLEGDNTWLKDKLTLLQAHPLLQTPLIPPALVEAEPNPEPEAIAEVVAEAENPLSVEGDALEKTEAAPARQAPPQKAVRGFRLI